MRNLAETSIMVSALQKPCTKDMMVSVRFQRRVNFYIVFALLKPYTNDIMVSVRIQLSVNLDIDFAKLKP